MRVHLLGVRGSTPCPGPEFVAVGGHTACVAIAHDGHPPALVLDAGTGLRLLPGLLDGGPFVGTILLGHLRWDHTQGLPFCPSIDRDDASVRLLLPAQGERADHLLARAMSPPHFPIRPDQLRGAWSFENLDVGWHDIEQFRVLAAEIPHKGGRTFGLRVEDGTSAIAYLSDHAPQELGPGPDGWGDYHAAADYAVGLAAHAGARRVLLYHHDPSRTDDEVDELVAAVASRHADVAVEAARQGMVLDVG